MGEADKRGKEEVRKKDAEQEGGDSGNREKASRDARIGPVVLGAGRERGRGRVSGRARTPGSGHSR